MNPDEQHVALPKLYGAPAYARPPRPIETIERPPDPDDLPLEAFRTDEDELVLAPVLSPAVPQTSAGGDGRRLLIAPGAAPVSRSTASDPASRTLTETPEALTTAAGGPTRSAATPGPSAAAPAPSGDAAPPLRPRPFSVRSLARLLPGRDQER